MQYISRVLRGWWFFWRAPVYWEFAAIASSGLASTLSNLVFGARAVMFFANMVFIVSSILGLIFKGLRRVWALDQFMWLIAASIWATSIMSSLLDHGDNPRFLVPLQTAVIFWCLWIAFTSYHSLRVKDKEPPRERITLVDLE